MTHLPAHRRGGRTSRRGTTDVLPMSTRPGVGRLRELVVNSAVDDPDRLARKVAEMRESEGMLHCSPHLNHRQRVVVQDAMRDPGEPFTIAAQARRHRVIYESARSDLLALERLGLSSKSRVGNHLGGRRW